MATFAELSQFEEIFKKSHRRLCNLSYKIVGEKAASEDLVQELFVKLWKKRKTLDVQDLKTYLNKSIVNASLNYLKSSKNKVLLTIESTPEIGSNVTEEHLQLTELQVKIDLAVKKLPPKCQTIFALSRFEGMSSKEIAKYLDVSTKTVDNQIGIALSKLREELKPYLIVSVVSLLLLLLLLLLVIG